MLTGLLSGAIAFALLCASPSLAAGTSVETPDLTYLEKWEGEYPGFDKKSMSARPTGKKFWDDPNVLSVMKKNIPVELMKKIITGWNTDLSVVENPIAKKGDTLFVFVCKPHFCSSNAARLYFNLKKKTVQVCWTEMSLKTKKQVDLWISKDIRRLGPDACLRNDGFGGLREYGDPNG